MNSPRPPKSSAAPPTTSAGEAHLDWSVRAGAVDDVVQAMGLRVSLRRRRRRRLQAIAGAAVALTLGAWVLQRPDPAASPAAASSPVSAIVSAPERQMLPDGTIVELKPGARVTSAFTRDARRVFLAAGEAHFQVAKNLDWPFVVVAAGVEFRAVGTAFSVQLGDEAVELLVTEGRVAVDPSRPENAPAASPHEPAAAVAATTERSPTLALVDAGRRLSVSTRSGTTHVASAIEALPPAELGERLAWRVPRLEFSGTPLSEALPLFNQHSAVKLKLADPELSKLRLSGILRADNVDTLLSLLAESHGIQVERRNGDEILLRGRP